MTFEQIVDPSINTITYLYVLLAEINTPGGKQKVGNTSDGFKPGAKLWQRMLDFMERFDPVQIRYAGNELRRLMDITALKARIIHVCITMPTITHQTHLL